MRTSGMKGVFPLPFPSTKSLSKWDPDKFLWLEEAEAVPNKSLSEVNRKDQEELPNRRKKSYIPMM